MGKKSKKAPKVAGATRTAARTDKKLATRLKKELAELGEEDVEQVVAQLEREEAKRNAVSEKTLAQPPEPRAYASLTAHPTNMNELIMFGGEYHNGQKTVMYNELLVYNTASNEWRRIKAPGAPPPRSAHQTIASAANKGELWIFGGEFTSPSETQFYHYKDLWHFSLTDRKWEKVLSPGGPSARSGHRAVALGKKIYVFGGYTDNGRDYRYYSDLHVFCLDTRTWSKLEPAGRGPAPRSGCLLLPGGNESLMVYGGFSRTKVGKNEQSVTYRDLYRLSQNSAGAWKWSEVNGGGPGNMVSPRSGLSVAVNTQAKKAYVFGGVTDIEETDEQLTGELSNELQCLELESGRWFDVALRRPGRRTAAADGDGDGDAVTPAAAPAGDAPVTVITDEVFTMMLGGPSAAPTAPTAAEPPAGGPDAGGGGGAGAGGPSARMNAMTAIQKSVLYVYGGVLEKGQKQFTLSDMYSLDLHKLSGWKVLLPQSSLPEWCGSESEEEYSSSEGSGSGSGESGSDSDSQQ